MVQVQPVAVAAVAWRGAEQWRHDAMLPLWTHLTALRHAALRSRLAGRTLLRCCHGVLLEAEAPQLRAAARSASQPAAAMGGSRTWLGARRCSARSTSSGVRPSKSELLGPGLGPLGPRLTIISGKHLN